MHEQRICSRSYSVYCASSQINFSMGGNYQVENSIWTTRTGIKLLFKQAISHENEYYNLVKFAETMIDSITLTERLENSVERTWKDVSTDIEQQCTCMAVQTVVRRPWRFLNINDFRTALSLLVLCHPDRWLGLDFDALTHMFD
jgi:hypothetical protein